MDTIKEAAELGFIDFDTAPHYGLGLSELRTGAALKKYAYRFGRPVRLWTKVRVSKGVPAHTHGLN
jgi:aryl-alcohol dehydrogenase-like predicted oxidoreductase